MTTLLKEALVGRTADGDRVYLDVDVSDRTRYSATVDHQTVSVYRVVTMFGLVVRKGARNWDEAGQVLDVLDEIVEPASSFTLEDVANLCGVWRRWHLNDSRSHCIHQDKTVPWNEVSPCPVTGYRAGSAWLVEPLPADGTLTIDGDPVALLENITDDRSYQVYSGR